jgi:glycosyltransferase involved in cell wall biosynthesis
MSKVTVSICIPTYNQVDHLQKCIQSILIQDYLEYEIIISDDSTNDLVKNYIDSLNLNQTIKYYHNSPSLGSPENWNNAVSKAEGEYIKILHHDDFFTEKYSLSSLVNLLDTNPQVDLVFSIPEVLFVKSNKRIIQKPSKKSFLKFNKDFYFLFFKNVINAPSTTLYRKIVKVNYDKRFIWLVDVDFYISVLEKNKNVIYIDKTLVCISSGAEGQITQQVAYKKSVQIREHILLFSKIINQVKSQKNYFTFFDELFLRYEVNSLHDLKLICEVPENLNEFSDKVFRNLHKFKMLKRIKYRLLNSKYNRRYFKIEKY